MFTATSAPHLKFLPSGPSLAVDQQLPSGNVHLFLSLNRCLHVNRFKNDVQLLQMGSLAKHEANVWKE